MLMDAPADWVPPPAMEAVTLSDWSAQDLVGPELDRVGVGPGRVPRVRRQRVPRQRSGRRRAGRRTGRSPARARSRPGRVKTSVRATGPLTTVVVARQRHLTAARRGRGEPRRGQVHVLPGEARLRDEAREEVPQEQAVEGGRVVGGDLVDELARSWCPSRSTRPRGGRPAWCRRWCRCERALDVGHGRRGVGARDVGEHGNREDLREGRVGVGQRHQVGQGGLVRRPGRSSPSRRRRTRLVASQPALGSVMPACSVCRSAPG